MYTIGKRERTSFLDDRNMATDGYRVWYVMEDGTSDYVEIAKGQFTPDNVREEIDKAIALHRGLVGA